MDKISEKLESNKREGGQAVMSAKELEAAKQLLEDIGTHKKTGIVIIQEIIQADTETGMSVSAKGIVAGSSTRMAIAHVLMAVLKEMDIKKSLIVEALFD